MSLSESELDQILHHCRALLDAAQQLNMVAVDRHRSASGARRKWTGEHDETFGLRMESEAEDLVARSGELLGDANSWAQVWADAVNQINGQRRELAVEDEKNQRGGGERFVDVFHGDDSQKQIRSYEPVSVPTSQTRYAATGGLETF